MTESVAGRSLRTDHRHLEYRESEMRTAVSDSEPLYEGGIGPAGDHFGDGGAPLWWGG